MHIKGYPPRSGNTTPNSNTPTITTSSDNNDNGDSNRATPTKTDDNAPFIGQPIPSIPVTLDTRNMDLRQTTLDAQTKASPSTSPFPGTVNGDTPSLVSPSSPDGSLQSPCSSGSPSPRSMSMDSTRSDTDRDESMNSSSPETQPESLSLPANIHHQQQQIPQQHIPSTPIYPVMPAKRRVGRPPGTTKKARHSYDMSERQRQPQNGGLTLRKFFELGGRDYSEFLKLEKSGTPLQTERQSNPAMSNPSFHPANLGSPVMVNSHTVTSPVSMQGVPYQQGHLSHSPAGSMTTLRPALSPEALSPKTKSQPPMLIHIRDVNRFSSTTSPPPPYPGPPTIIPTGQQQQFLKQSHMFLQQQHQQHTQSQQLQQHQQHQPHHLQSAVLTQPLQQAPLVGSCDPAALDLSAKPRQIELRQDITPSVQPSQRLPVMEIKPTPVEEVAPCRIHPTERQSSPIPDLQQAGTKGKTDINGNHTMGLESRTTSPALSEGCNIESWDVQQVVQFVSSVPSCQEYAETFREQRIDGATLPYLSEEHLLSVMKMKLGPAIRLRMALKQLTAS